MRYGAWRTTPPANHFFRAEYFVVEPLSLSSDAPFIVPSSAIVVVVTRTTFSASSLVGFPKRVGFGRSGDTNVPWRRPPPPPRLPSTLAE